MPESSSLLLARGQGWRGRPRRPRQTRLISEAKTLLTVVVPALLVAVWWLVTWLRVVPLFLLPSPIAVWRAGTKLVLTGELFSDIVASLARVGLGIGIGVGLGFLLGAAVGWWRAVSLLVEPTLHVVRQIPPLAWIPFALLWFRGGLFSAVFIVVLVSFFPVFVGTAQGVRSAPETLLDMAKTCGASRWRQLSTIAIPAALPSIVTALRVAMGGGWMAVVAAEYFGYRYGLGALAFNSYQVLRIDLVVVAMLVIGVLGFLLDLIVRTMANRLVWWAGR